MNLNLRPTTQQKFDLVLKVKNSKLPFCSTIITSSQKKYKVLPTVTFRSFYFSKNCLRAKKNESHNELFSETAQKSFYIKTSVLGWKKSVATIFYLLIAYKKTARIKFQYYFSNLTLLQFGIALSPFIAYLIQISLEKYELQYQKNTFLHRSLPTFVKPIPKITWDTFAYTKYSKKFDTILINQVTSVDDCFFISLNPNWQFKQKQILTGTFKVDDISRWFKPAVKRPRVPEWFFLPSRYFYQLLSKNEKLNWNSGSLVKPGLSLQKLMERNSRWQLFYNDLDDIPTKLNGLFTHSPRHRFRLLGFESDVPFDSFFLILPQSQKKKFTNWACLLKGLQSSQTVSWGDFCNLDGFYDFGSLPDEFVKTLDDLQVERVLCENFENGEPSLLFRKTKSQIRNTRSTKARFQLINGKVQKIVKLRTPSSFSIRFSKKKLLFNPNLITNNFSEFKKTDWIGLLQPVSAQSSNLGQALNTIKGEKVILRGRKSWINQLTETLNKEILKTGQHLVSNRKFQYNMFFGFSKFSKILQLYSLPVKKAVTFKPSEKFEAILRDQLQSDINTRLTLLKKELEPFSISPIVPTLPLTEEFPLQQKKKKISGRAYSRSGLSGPYVRPNEIIRLQRKGEKNQFIKVPNLEKSPVKSETSPKAFKLNRFNERVEIESKFNQEEQFFLITFSSFKKILSRVKKVAKVKDNPNQSFVNQIKLARKDPEDLLVDFYFKSIDENEISLKHLLHRKSSGYLHPDTFREIILTNPRLFNVNILNPKNILSVSPFSFRSYSEKLSTLLLSRRPLLFQESQSERINNSFNYSLIQIDQPLSHDLLNSKPFCDAENERKSLLLFSNVQKKKVNFIEPDKSFTAKKESFFGMPLRSPYGVKLEEYRSQLFPFYFPGKNKAYGEKRFPISPFPALTVQGENEKPTTDPETKKKIQKHFLARYDDSLNFLLQNGRSLKETKKKKTETSSESSTLIPDFRLGINQLQSNSKILDDFYFAKVQNQRVTNQELLTEITKASTFSTVVLEKSLTFSPLNSSSFLTKKENFFDLEQQPVSYQTPFQYTKSKNARLFSPRGNNLRSQRPLILSGSQKSQNSNLKIANKSRVLNVLYQQPNNFFKTWTILSQLGFVFIVAKLTQILQKEYIDEFLYYITEFYAFLNEYDKSNLQIFLQGDNYRVIKNSKKKFNDLVGGRFLLTEFGDAILLLRNSHKSFYKIQINKPQLVTFINLEKFSTQFPLGKFSSFFSSKIGGEAKNLGHVETLPKKSLVYNLKNLVFFLRNRKNFDFKQRLKTSELLQELFVNGPISEFQAQLNQKKQKQKAFIENAGFKLDNLIPKGILLVGPPGCGKTLFVQALAGEASVPVIVESGQMLNTNIETNGTERLQDLFKAAREMSPCILFFDEIDTIGQKREKVLSSFTTNEKENKIPNILNRIYLQNGLLTKQQESNLFLTKNLNWKVLNPLLQFQMTKQSSFKKQTDLQIEITNQKIASEKQQNQNLVILTQLLCELDGLTQKQEIIVIGATNRPSTLDPALTRPGRFGKVIYLGLPGKQKRFELLKFYSFAPSGKPSSLSLEGKGFSSRSSFFPSGPSFDSISNQSFGLDWFRNLPGIKKKSENLSSVPYKQKEQRPKFLPNGANSRSKVSTLGTEQKFRPLGANKGQLNVSPGFQNNGNLILNKIGVDENINWNYFANQTSGLSSAHISAAINRSALKAIFVFISNRQKKTSPFFLKNFLNPVSLVDDGKSQNFLDKNFTKTQIPKEIKLRVLVQSGSKFNRIFNQLISTYKKSHLSIGQSQVSNFGENFVGTTFQNMSPKVLQNLKLYFNFLSHNQILPKYKKQPLHTFETIEYGIQTISTINTGYQSHLLKGKKTNNKILSPVLDEDCFVAIQKGTPQKEFQSKNNGFTPLLYLPPFASNIVTTFLPFFPFGSRLQNKNKGARKALFLKVKSKLYLDSKVLITSKVQSKSRENPGQVKCGLKRSVFYQKHRQYFRTLALLGGQPEILGSLVQQPVKAQQVKILLIQIIKRSFLLWYKNKSCKKIKRKLAQIKNFFLRALTFFELTILNRYVNRITKNHSFGFLFLFNSTCLIKNSLVVFSIQNQNQKILNFIYYPLIFFKASKKKETCHILLQWQNWNSLSQSHLFGDSLFINRSAYYLSGKALLTSEHRIDKKIEQPIHLWSFVGAVQKRQKKNLEFQTLLTKSQFEQFLVSLIAGKAGETLMLSAQLGSQKKNTSTIGIEELKEFGLVSKLMIENYLFYSQKELTRKQININLVENAQQIHQKEERLFLKELATLFEISTNNSLSMQKNSLKPYDQFESFDQPWWQFKAIPLVVSLNLNYKKWYRLFVYEEQQNLRNIEWVAPDKTFHTQLNVSHLVSNTKVGFDLRRETDNYFVNRELVSKYIEFSQLNWNQLQLLQSDSLSSSFLFEAFNKVFSLLETNLEFIDFLVYSLLCQETVHAFAISKYQQRFSHPVFSI